MDFPELETKSTLQHFVYLFCPLFKFSLLIYPLTYDAYTYAWRLWYGKSVTLDLM